MEKIEDNFKIPKEPLCKNNRRHHHFIETLDENYEKCSKCPLIRKKVV